MSQDIALPLILALLATLCGGGVFVVKTVCQTWARCYEAELEIRSLRSRMTDSDDDVRALQGTIINLRGQLLLLQARYARLASEEQDDNHRERVISLDP